MIDGPSLHGGGPFAYLGRMTIRLPTLHEFRAREGGGALYPLQMSAPDIEAWLLAKNPRGIDAYNEIGPEEYARSFTVARSAGADMIDDLYFAFVDNVARGGSEADFGKLVIPTLKAKGWLGGDEGKIASRVALIYDTNLRLARAAGRWDAFQATKAAFPYLEGFTVGDERVRHPPHSPSSDHRAWDGIILPVDHPFWRRWWTPLGFRCFLPQTRVKGAVRGGIRRWHDGKAVELTMRSGARLSVTPDHPILTGHGWVIAEHVRVGDHALRDTVPINRKAALGVSDQHSPPRADQLFDALAATALAVPGVATLKLNDQPRGGQGKVDHVFFDANLSYERWADELRKHVLVGRHGPAIERETDAGDARESTYLRLADPNLRANGPHSATGIGAGIPEAALKFIVSGSRCGPSVSALAFNTARRLFDGLPLDRFRLGSAAQDDALFAELASDGRAIDAGLFRELLDAHTGKVAQDEVVEVRQFNFSGHVYDFQTEEGILAADNIIVHNCRCGINQMSRSQLARLGRGITSEADLADRERRLGEPIFLSPATPIEQQLDKAVERTNDARIPDRPMVDVGREIAEGAVAFERAVATTARNVLHGIANGTIKPPGEFAPRPIWEAFLAMMEEALAVYPKSETIAGFVAQAKAWLAR